MNSIKRLLARFEIPVNPGLAIVAGVVAIGVSGFMSLERSSLDQGRLIQPEEIPQLMAAEVERIKNDPYMPPQAKAAALGAMQQAPQLRGKAPLTGRI